jgi:16S rRNA (guanine527-N7)-methyltransferase
LEEAVEQHYVDSLLGLSFLKPKETVLDAGSGAGFPGLVAAVIWPKTEVVLIETARKKASFLQTVIREMKLKNVSVVQARIEDQNPAPMVLSRAAFSTRNLKAVAQAVLKNGVLALWLAEADTEKTVDILKEEGLLKRDVFKYRLQRGLPRVVLVAERST